MKILYVSHVQENLRLENPLLSLPIAIESPEQLFRMYFFSLGKSFASFQKEQKERYYIIV